MKHKLLGILLTFVAVLCLCLGVACGESGGNGRKDDDESNANDPLIGLWTGKMEDMDVELSIAEWDGDLYFFMASKIDGIRQGGSGGHVVKTDTGCTLIISDEEGGTASCTLSDEALTANIPMRGSVTVPIVFALSEKKELPPTTTMSLSGKWYYDETEYPYLDEVNNVEEDMEPYTNTGRYFEADFSTGAVSYYKISGYQGTLGGPMYHSPGSIVSYTGEIVKIGEYLLILSSDALQSVIVFQENDTLQMMCPDFVWHGPVELTSSPNRERVKLTIRYQGNVTGEVVYMAVKGKKISELRIHLYPFYEFDETVQEIVLNEDTEITLYPSSNS